MKNSMNSKLPTVFTNNDLGIKLQKMWLEEHLETLINYYEMGNSEFILVTPQEVGSSTARVSFYKVEEFRCKDYSPYKKVVDLICNYAEKMNAENKLIVFFMNDFGRLSKYTCITSETKVDEVIKLEYYSIEDDKIVIDFDFLKEFYVLNDNDIKLLKNLEYFPRNGWFEDLNGAVREVEPILFGILEYTFGAIFMLEKTKSEGFRKTYFVLETDGNLINMYDKATLESNISLGMAIFKKISPETFGYFFEEDNSVQKAS